MIENISDVIAIKDGTGIITYISSNIKKLFGWDPGAIIGSNISGLILPLPPKENLKDELSPGEDGAMTVTECMCRHKYGSDRVIRLTAVNLVHNPDINGILLNFHDITESKRRENEILYLSYHDSLTGLYNRAFFDEEKERLNTGRQLPVSIIMGDVNGLNIPMMLWA
jgi:PAS domain S-box-containing protein